MPKKKTKKAAAKRFSKTSRGNIKFGKAGAGHLLGGKTRKHKRRLRSKGVLGPADRFRIGELF